MSERLLQDGWREDTREINGLNLHVVEAGDPGDHFGVPARL